LALIFELHEISFEAKSGGRREESGVKRAEGKGRRAEGERKKTKGKRQKAKEQRAWGGVQKSCFQMAMQLTECLLLVGQRKSRLNIIQLNISLRIFGKQLEKRSFSIIVLSFGV
jgi:hypothetical protein